MQSGKKAPESGGQQPKDGVVAPFRTELGKRIAQVLDKFDSRKAAADVAGVNPDQLAKYVAGTAKPSFEVLARLALATGDSLDWLAEGNHARDGAPPLRSWTALAEPLASGAEPIETMQGLVSVPFYDARAGAEGAQLAYADRAKARLIIGREWLESWHVTPLSAQIITASSDSMVPTIAEGDLMLVDTKLSALQDAIYVIRREGDLIVRRVQRRMAGQIMLIPDNSAYEGETLSPSDAEALWIVGRVRVIFKTV